MSKRNFVLVHGAFHGGWCWRYAADTLRAAGHRVFTPTLTGLGDRHHLLSASVNLDTWTADLINLLEFEELEETILVGHSFGGITITAAADRVPARIRHLIYLDSLIVEHGEAPFDLQPPLVVAERKRLAQESSAGLSIPPPALDFIGISDPAALAWVERHLTPHPLGTFTERVCLANPFGNGLPRTYICCTNPLLPNLAASRQRVKGSTGWDWREINTGHNAMVTMPAELATLLVTLAD